MSARSGFRGRARWASVFAACVLLTAPIVEAQVIANPSAAATAMGGAFTATARGLDAPAWNPAGLAMPGTSAFSFAALLSFSLEGGSGPLGGKDFKPYSGDSIPFAVRKDWLRRIRANGGQTVNGAGDFSLLALNIGSVGLAVTNSVHASGNIPADAAEVLLFGNYGYADSLRSYSLQGARVDGSSITTAALSYGFGFGNKADRHFAIGVTGKYMIGNFLGIVKDAGSTVSSSPLDVSVNMLAIASDTGGPKDLPSRGTGYGVDIGAAWVGGPLKVGLVVHDIVNTFKWDVNNMYAQGMTEKFNANTRTSTRTPWRKVSTLTGAARDSVDRVVSPLKIDPTAALGVSLHAAGAFTISGEYETRLGDGMQTSPKTRLGAGVQWKGIPFLPLRVGYSQTPDVSFYTGGLGLDFAIVRLDVGAGVNTKSSGDGILALTLSFGPH